MFLSTIHSEVPSSTTMKVMPEESGLDSDSDIWEETNEDDDMDVSEVLVDTDDDRCIIHDCGGDSDESTVDAECQYSGEDGNSRVTVYSVPILGLNSILYPLQHIQHRYNTCK
mmetsp:Transcript_39632/g.95773  ORF Transcript_39632/g.95773 Transcript_39632/m.95773 type:complete len:113 (+) Transcript_39632:1195-1533(+)